jgi:hypothetical protein
MNPKKKWACSRKTGQLGEKEAAKGGGELNYLASYGDRRRRQEF